MIDYRWQWHHPSIPPTEHGQYEVCGWYGDTREAEFKLNPSYKYGNWYDLNGNQLNIEGIAKWRRIPIDDEGSSSAITNCTDASQTKTLFLGGTCNNSTWRDELIPLLNIEYFNPVVKDWMPECQNEEIRQRATCDYVLYVITPLMTGTYSIAEVVDDSNKRPEKTIFCALRHDVETLIKFMPTLKTFDNGQWRSLQMAAKMVKENGGYVASNLQDVADYVNEKYEMTKE